MRKLYSAFILLLLICCNSQTPPKAKADFKDSMIKEFLTRIDSSEFYDTTNFNYKILKAYVNDDTGFLKNLANDWKSFNAERIKYPDLDTCTHLKRLSELNVDEVYRFSHRESFCFYSQSVTISRIGDSVFLHYLEYSFHDEGKIVEYRDKSGLKQIGPGCKVEKEFYRKLEIGDWNKLDKKIKEADYWGLKENNFRLGFDGSSWRIDGYVKRPRYITGQRVHSVYRWSPQNSFEELGRMFMKLAGEQSMCSEFY